MKTPSLSNRGRFRVPAGGARVGFCRGAVYRRPVIRAVGFDLDDTLAVTDVDRDVLLARAAEAAGVPSPPDREAYLEAHRRHSGAESREPVFEALVGPADAAAFAAAYREAVGEALVPVEGAEAVVAELRARYRVGLLTDGPDDTQRDKLRRLGWADAFDAVVVTGAIGTPKPDPAAFAALLESLGVDAAEAVYVGDNPERDVSGAAAAGLWPVQVLYDGGPDPHPDAAATLPRSDLRALPGHIEGLGGGHDDA